MVNFGRFMVAHLIWLFIILGEIDIQQLISTRDFLHEALHEAESKLEIAGSIQAFEVCYELA